MDNNTQVSNSLVFASFAGNDAHRWNQGVGAQVVHVKFGCGVITRIEVVAMTPYIWIRFEHVDDDSEPEICFVTAAFLEEKITDMLLPDDLQKDEVLLDHRRLQERLRQEEVERRLREDQSRQEQERLRQEQSRQAQAEAEARKEFERLKLKYGASGFEGRSLINLLYPILLKLESGEALDQKELDWLKKDRLSGPLAFHYEKEWERSGDGWKLILAGSNFRDSGQPKKVIALTDGVVFPGRKEHAALLTVRGGAFRDLGQLDEAMQCAQEALTYHESFYPYSLLGAICYQDGTPEKGDEYFAKALSLGAELRSQESEIKGAVKKAEPENAKRVAEYLLKKDPKRYSWAEHYLNQHL